MIQSSGETVPAVSRSWTTIRLVSAVKNVWWGLADLLLPGVCGGCGRGAPQAGGLCQGCGVKLLERVSLPYCPRCGATLGPYIPVYPGGCSACPNPLPRFSRVIRLGPYAPPLRGAIRELKYLGRIVPARRLGTMLAQSVRACGSELPFDVVVPVPMHWRRRLARGVDHAATLAETLAGALRLPISDELIRTRDTPPQVRCSRTERIAGVRGAFAARDGSIRGARVLLVDDVTTTGATASECARTLLRTGATDVTLAVLAKAEPPTAYAHHWDA
jgi:ComF family protein